MSSTDVPQMPCCHGASWRNSQKINYKTSCRTARLPSYPERLLEPVDGLLLLGAAPLPQLPLPRDHAAHRPLLAPRRPGRSHTVQLPPAKIV